MNKTTISLAVIAVIAVVAYFYYSGGSSSSSSLLQAESGAASGVGSQELALLQQIRSLRIDASLFSNPAYSTLRDYSVPIPPLDVGRVNPFAPLPGVPSSSGTGSTNH